MDFLPYLKAVVTPAKSNRHLTFQQSFEAMRMLLQEDLPVEQMVAFLVAWRLKPEQLEELQGALAYCNTQIKKRSIPRSIELSYSYSGKRKTPYLFGLTAHFLAHKSWDMVLCGEAQSFSNGAVNLYELFKAYTFLSNVHLFDRADFFPALNRLSPMRDRLRVKSALNSLEKLSHVALSPYAVMGLFHSTYIKKYQALFSKQYKRLALLQAKEGASELFFKGRLYLCEQERISEYKIDPAYYGISYRSQEHTFDLQDNIKLLKEPSEELLKLARLNAAIYLFVAQEYASVGEAYEELLSVKYHKSS